MNDLDAKLEPKDLVDLPVSQYLLRAPFVVMIPPTARLREPVRRDDNGNILVVFRDGDAYNAWLKTLKDYKPD